MYAFFFSPSRIAGAGYVYMQAIAMHYGVLRGETAPGGCDGRWEGLDASRLLPPPRNNGSRLMGLFDRC